MNDLDIKKINPNISPKFSPNLYRWMNHRNYRPFRKIAKVYSDPDGILWIGSMDEPGPCFTGCRLMGVLCKGGREQSGAYMQKKFVAGLTEIPDFWQRYTENGRCAIDTDHRMYFIGDGSRWAYNDDRTERHCLWCGMVSQSLHKWVEPVEKSQWVNAATHANAA